MLLAKPSHLLLLRKTPLYQTKADGGQAIFKPSGKTLVELGLPLGQLPKVLYIRPEDQPAALAEVQEALNHQLMERLQGGDLAGTRDTMQDLLEVSLSLPSPASLEGVGQAAARLVEALDGQAEVARALSQLSFADYSTTLHSVNMMFLALSFAMASRMSLPQSQNLATAALLHDVGKIRVDLAILNAPRKLSEAEFAEIKRHPLLGYRMLARCSFRDRGVALAAFQHHEKLDGSGYPQGLTDISPLGRVVAVLDCYEALTCDTRPYRKAMSPFAALDVVRQDANAGKYDRRVLERFVASLM